MPLNMAQLCYSMLNYAMLSHATLSQRAALSCAMLGQWACRKHSSLEGKQEATNHTHSDYKLRFAIISYASQLCYASLCKA